MRVGTKSILFGVHQCVLHPLFVLRAWILLFGWPRYLYEYLAILTHDLGYWHSPNMDGPEGENHPEVAALYWFKKQTLLGSSVGDEILGHSRFYAAKYHLKLTKLFQADKLATSLYPMWLYLLLARLSGEIHEYIQHSTDGKYAAMKFTRRSQKLWFIDVRARMALMGVLGENYASVKKQIDG